VVNGKDGRPQWDLLMVLGSVEREASVLCLLLS